jgi:hypothetical protein
VRASYSGILRARVAAALVAGASARASAKRFGVSGSGAIRSAQRRGSLVGARDRRRSPVASRRAPRGGIGAGGSPARPNLTGDPQCTGGGAGGHIGLTSLAFSEGTGDHPQKTEPTRRRAGSLRYSRGRADLHPPPAGTGFRPPGLHRRDLARHQYARAETLCRLEVIRPYERRAN